MMSINQSASWKLPVQFLHDTEETTESRDQAGELRIDKLRDSLFSFINILHSMFQFVDLTTRGQESEPIVAVDSETLRCGRIPKPSGIRRISSGIRGNPSNLQRNPSESVIFLAESVESRPPPQ
jgi:hypothetical protein